MEPAWIVEARKYEGLREVRGSKHNPKIVTWWSLIRAPFTDDETSWCAAYVGGSLEAAGIRSSRSAAARSYLNWGIPLDLPTYGCVIVFSRPPSTWSGHVGFEVGMDKSGRPLVLGGNQGDAVSILPFDPSRILGRRWPVDAMQVARLTPPTLMTFGPTSTNEA